MAGVTPEVSVSHSQDELVLILKLTGQSCNVDCLYCYERRKPDRGGHLSAREVATLLDGLGSRHVHCILHGGEPLLIGTRRMREILSVLASSERVRSLSIQTNATLLNEEWIELFEDIAPGMVWGVSFDGLGELGAYRVDYKGQPIGQRTLDGVSLLEEHDIKYGVICVVTDQHVGRGRDYVRGLSDRSGVTEVKLLPCYDENVTIAPRDTISGRMMKSLTLRAGAPAWAVDPIDYAQFVIDAQDEWIESGLWRRFALEPSASIVANLAGAMGSYTDYASAKDSQLLTLYPGGRVAGHDRGHEFDLVESTSSSIESFLEQQMDDALTEWQPFLEECRRCWAWQGCRGGELFMRKQMRDAGLDDRFCDARRLVVSSVQRMRE